MLYKKYFILALILLTQINSKAQNNNYVNHLNYRVPYTPITSCFAENGELKVHLARQFYFPDIDWVSQYNTQERVEATLANIWGNYLLNNDNRISISYSVSNNISLRIGYLHAKRSEVFLPEGLQFHNHINAFDLGSTYHNYILPNLQWEVGTSFMLGKGHFSCYEANPALHSLIDFLYTHIRYTTFNHNFVVGTSVEFWKMQISVQCNAGYLRHFNIKYNPVFPKVYEHIGKHFYDHLVDYYIDPALLVALNLKRFTFQFHTAYPYSFGERMLSRHTLALGLGLSYKLF